MKKTYTKPEIVVSKFDVETTITTDGSATLGNLTATIYGEGNTRDAVAVVDYTTIFSTNAD